MKGGQIVYSSGQKMSEEGHAIWQQAEDDLEFEREAQGAQEQTAEPASLASPDTVSKQLDWGEFAEQDLQYAEDDAGMDIEWETARNAEDDVDDLADALSEVKV